MKSKKALAATAVLTIAAVFLSACEKAGTDKPNTQTETAVQSVQQTDVPISWAEAESFSAPAEMPQTTKKADGQKTDDTAYALQRIEAAHAVYDLFIGTKPALDKSDSVVYENNLEYYHVIDPKLDSLKKLSAYVQKFFSEEITQSLMRVEMYVELDGKLYVPDVGMQSTQGLILAKKVEITEKTDKSESYTLTLTLDKDGDGKVDATETHSFTCEPVGPDNSWVFTHFEMY